MRVTLDQWLTDVPQAMSGSETTINRLFPHPARTVQQLSSATRRTESCPRMIGPISPDVKQMGARSAGNPHAACDVEGAGNVARSGYWDTRRRKGEPTGETNFGLNRRASPRPYRKGRSSSRRLRSGSRSARKGVKGPMLAQLSGLPLSVACVFAAPPVQARGRL